MKYKDEQALLLAILQVRSHQPEVYKELVKGMRAHAMHCMQEVVMARVDLLPHFQGKAREALELSELFEDAANILQKIKGTP